MALKDLPADAQPREKLLARGPGALSDAELLALLLRTGMAGKGVLQLGAELLAAPPEGFGGIAGLLHASAEDLKRIKGLGPAKRAELVAVLELARRAMAEQLREREVFSTPDAVKHYLQLHLARRQHEVFAVLFLDSQNRLIALEELFRGTLTQTSVYPREVVLRALHHHAAAVVLAHNHPSGSVQPSRADEALTQTLKAALALVDVRVLDHVIVAPGPGPVDGRARPDLKAPMKLTSLKDLQQVQRHLAEAQARAAAQDAARREAERRLQAERDLFTRAVGAVKALPDARKAQLKLPPPEPVAVQQQRTTRPCCAKPSATNSTSAHCWKPTSS
jgi:DNA repair protein RadC